MRILWVDTDFLHPATRGRQRRTLEILRRLHQQHEIHYIAFDRPDQPEGPRRSTEYSSFHYAVRHTPSFAGQLLAGAVSSLPVAVNRWRSLAMKHEIDRLRQVFEFDAVVCGFLSAAPNISDLSSTVMFQHNVEAGVWRRQVEHAANFIEKAYFQLQARRMAQYEGDTCRQAKRVIAVSEANAEAMRRDYGLRDVATVPAGVDIEHWRRPQQVTPNLNFTSDVVFAGSMDRQANIDGVRWFVREVFPLIVKTRSQTTFHVVGRKPPPDIDAMSNERIKIVGAVPDVRPYLWDSKLAVVPLRTAGAGSEIYHAMAASLPVVATRAGAEGLHIDDGRNIAIADEAAAFAERCVALLNNAAESSRMAERALETTVQQYCWDSVAAQFGRLLQ